MYVVEVKELTEEEIQESINEYINSTAFIEYFNSRLFSGGIVKKIDANLLQKWFANPEKYQKELENVAMYYYITNSSIFQLYDLTEVLPTLNYRINVIDKGKDNDENKNEYEKNINQIKSILKKVKHKSLTRDLITQTIGAGTLCGLWIGNKKNLDLFVFNDLKYVFPAYLEGGEWRLWFDLSWFDKMTEFQRDLMFEKLSPYVTKKDYEKYTKDSTEIKYVELPIDRSVCLRTHTIYRNQRLGIPWGTQSFFDNIHKEKLKDLEKSISNKVINSVAVLTLGNEKLNESTIPPNKRRKVYAGVKNALKKNGEDGITVIGIPEWTGLDFPEVHNTDALDPKKFESTNDDLNTSTNGVMNIINGKSNYSSGKLSIELFYRKIAVLLEQIEEQVYQKLINLILKKKDKDNYSIEYDKQQPLTTDKQIEVLKTLNTTFGFSLKAVIDRIDGVDFEQYIKDSLYEQNVLKLPQKIKPYSNAYTQNDKGNNAGAPEVDDVDNSSTESTKTSGGNNNPKPSTS